MMEADREQLLELRKANDVPKLEALARQLLTTNPAHVPALEGLAVALYRTQRWLEMELVFQQIERLDPTSLDLFLGRGTRASDLELWEEAEAFFRRGHELHPSDWRSLFHQAYANEHLRRHDQAAILFGQCALIHPQPQECWYCEAVNLLCQGEIDKGYEAITRAVGVDPENRIYLQTLADALCDVGRVDEAGAILQKCKKMDHARTRPTLARWHLVTGDLQVGFKELSDFIHSDFNKFRRDVEGTAWTGQPLKDKTLLLYEEQGFGDTFQFIRYAEMLAGRGANVFVEVAAPLKQMISRVKGVAWVFLHETERPKYDYSASIMDLPRLMNTKLSNIPAKVPYLKAPARLVEFWKERLSGDTGKLKVGLCWFGRPTHQEDKRRSMTPDMLLPLSEVRDVASFYSLQRQAPAAAVELLTQSLGMIDHTARLNDFADTAALMANLDLVVTVDTSIAHLAGGMALPVWTVLPRGAEWRWLINREDSPWYPTMRLFRQKDAGGWKPVIERVRDEIRQKAVKP